MERPYLKIKAFFMLILRGKFRYLYAGLRRRALFYCARRYVDNQLRMRKGVCSSAGHCCKMTLPWCRYFKAGVCSVYDKQPFFCKIFPIDEKDKDLSDVKEVCGYYFKEI